MLSFDCINKTIDTMAFACFSLYFNFSITADSLKIFIQAKDCWAAAKSRYITLILYKYTAN